MHKFCACYHYTDFSSARRIFIQGQILPSQKAKGDAVHGNGVYMTTLDPRLGKDTVWKNNWDGMTSRIDEKMECYFEILIPSDEVMRAKEKRDIQVFPRTLPLSRYKWSLKNWSGELLATEHFIIRSEGGAATSPCMGRYTLCRYIVMPDGTPVYKHDTDQIFLYRNNELNSWYVGRVAGHICANLVQTSDSSSSPSKTIPWKYRASDGTMKIDETLRVDPIYVNHDSKKLQRKADILNFLNPQSKRQTIQ